MSKSINPLSILENIPEGVFATGRDCRITYFNQKAEEITGYTRDQVLGRTCYEIFRPEICQFDCSIKQSMATGRESFDHRVNILNRFHKPLSIRIQTSPMRNDRGEIIGGLQTFHVIERPAEEIRQELVLFELRKKMGRDRKLGPIYEILPDLANSDAPVLLQGEPGTGKRLLARAIHRLSAREGGPFYHVACWNKTGEELTKELLGTNLHDAPATGGEGHQDGVLRKAHQGTLFLEGIEVLPYSLQVSLFRAIEEGTYLAVGAPAPVDTDIRLIASTEGGLEEKVREGRFRENLFHCLNVFKIHVPSLRERQDDIPLLARDILWHLSLEKGKEVHEIEDAAVRLLQTYPFPGNLKELRKVLEEAYENSRGPSLRAQDLPPPVQQAGRGPSRRRRREPEGTWVREKEMILSALVRNRWNRKRAAHELGMNRTTLWRKMKQMGIRSSSPGRGEEQDG